MKYNPALDGIRALAILLVLCFHSGLQIFQSGFVGVDVFFVISGFLITKLIYLSLTEQQFSFIDFYNRRLWRLQPVFLCLIFVTTIITLLLYLPDDLTQYIRSARKSIFFMANSHFGKVATGYFAPDSHELPLLHTWSLAVEWQCYLILPILLYCLHKITAKHFVKIIYILTPLLFFWTWYHVREPQAYYSFVSRLFEFFIGACVVFLPIKTIKISKYLLNIIGLLALGVILVIAAGNDLDTAHYPNKFALLLCLAAASLIKLCEHDNLLITRIFATKPMVGIGVLSYSLYMWHWVILSILHYENIAESTSVTGITLLGIFICAYTSWRWIEKPTRRLYKIPMQYTVIFLLIIPMLIFYISAEFIKKYQGLPNRFSDDLAMTYQQLQKYKAPNREKCIGEKHTRIPNQCVINSEATSGKTALMIGDSFANHYWNFMQVFAKDADVKIATYGISSCLVLPGILLYDWWHFKNNIYQACHDQAAYYYELIKTQHFDYVIIGQVWRNYLGDHIINDMQNPRSIDASKLRIEQALNQALTLIISTGAVPVLINASAAVNKTAIQCMTSHLKQRKSYKTGACDFPLVLNANEKWFDGLFEKMHQKYPSLIVIDPKSVQCAQNNCHVDLDGVPVYRDLGHLTDYASYQLGIMYLKRYGNPLYMGEAYANLRANNKKSA